MSAPAPAAAQNTAQFNMATLLQQLPYKNLLRPEQITAQQFPFLSEQELNTYPTGVRNLWSVIAAKPADDTQHQQALTKLSQLTQTVLKKYQTYRDQVKKRIEHNQQAQQQQQGQQVAQAQSQPQQPQQAQLPQQQNQAQDGVPRPGSQGQQAQPQAQAQPQQQIQTQQQSQSQPQPQTQSVGQTPQIQNQAQQTAVPPGQARPNVPGMSNNTTAQMQQRDLTMGLLPIDWSQLEAPPQSDPEGGQRWLAEARKRYDSALINFRHAREEMPKVEMFVQQARQAGKDIPKELILRQEQLKKEHEVATKFIESMQIRQRQQQAMRNSAAANNPQAAAAAAAAAQQQARMQGAAAAPTNPAIEAAKQQQQIPRPASPAAPTPTNPMQMPMPPHMPQIGGMPTPQGAGFPRPQINPTQPVSSFTTAQVHSPGSILGVGAQGSPAPLSQQAAIAASQRSYSSNPQGLAQGAAAGTSSRPDLDKNNNRQWPMNKNWAPTTPQPVSMGAARPTLTGPNNGPMGVMGQPAIQKQPPFLLQGPGDRVLDKKKLDELVRQVTGGIGGGLVPEVEEAVLQLADEFVDNVIGSACKHAKLRGSTTLEPRDLQLVMERQYNIRVPGYALDEVRTVRKSQPSTAYLQKMNAIQAAKVMGGKADN